MKKILSVLFLCSLIFGSCSKNISDKENGKIRFMFEPGELKFISSSFNTDRQTMSALYGNKEALSLLEGARHSHDRVSLKLVTYKMMEDPQYFGSKVNGELLRVETVKPAAMANWTIPQNMVKYPPGNPESSVLPT